MVGGMPNAQSLFTSAFRPHDYIFGFLLNPEMWRVIGEVRYKSHERRGGTIAAKALRNRPIKMRDDGQYDIRRFLCPITSQRPDDRRVIRPDRSLQNDQQVRRDACPPLAQDQIVSVLNAQTGGAANQVERIQ